MSDQKKPLTYEEKLQLGVDRAKHFKPLFDMELFQEFWGLLGKKAARYEKLKNNPPKLDSTRYSDQVTRDDIGKVVSVAKVPYRVSKEDQMNHIDKWSYRLGEVTILLRLPHDMEKDAVRSEEELKKLAEKAKE